MVATHISFRYTLALTGLFLLPARTAHAIEWDKVQEKAVETVIAAAAVGAITFTGHYIIKTFDLLGEQAEKNKRWQSEQDLRQHKLNQKDEKLELARSRLCIENYDRMIKLDPNNTEMLKQLLECARSTNGYTYTWSKK
jgi:hypothetical protein